MQTKLLGIRLLIFKSLIILIHLFLVNVKHSLCAVLPSHAKWDSNGYIVSFYCDKHSTHVAGLDVKNTLFPGDVEGRQSPNTRLILKEK